LPFGIFSDVTTVVPFATDGSETASAFPAVTARLLDVVVSESRVVGVFEVAIATYVLGFKVNPEGLGDGFTETAGEAEGLGVAVGDGAALALGVGAALAVGDGLGVGDGVALAVGDGLGVGDGVGEGKGTGMIIGAGKLVVPPLGGV
jgi:hypothetical protein